MHAHSTLTGTYTPGLVALSVVIAILASYAALDLAGRVTAATGRARLLWLTGGAIAMGVGIWSMHYIGMLAFTLPVPVGYDRPTVALSLFAAVLAAAVALFVTSRPVMTVRHALVGSIFMGGGIASMHFIGMAAMRLPAMQMYSLPIVSLSVLLAIVISFIALWLTFNARVQQRALDWQKIGSAVAMGAAIPVMHYTAMFASTFLPFPDTHHVVQGAPISAIGITGITVVTFVVLGTVLVTSVLDRRMSALNARAEALREQEARFRAIAETANDAIVSADSLGGIIYCNPAAERIFGYAAADVLGVMLTTLTPIDGGEAVDASQQATCGDACARLSGRTVEIDGRRKDGSLFPVELSLATWTSCGDTHYTGILRDLTERKEAEAQLSRHRAEVETQRVKVFRATMTTVHDIVNNFLGNMQLVRMEADGHWPDETVTLFDSLIADAATELRVLSNLQTIRESEMEIGTGIDYRRTATS